MSKKILGIEMAKTGISAIFNEIFFRIAIEMMLDLRLRKLSKMINKQPSFYHQYAGFSSNVGHKICYERKIGEKS